MAKMAMPLQTGRVPSAPVRSAGASPAVRDEDVANDLADADLSKRCLTRLNHSLKPRLLDLHRQARLPRQ